MSLTPGFLDELRNRLSLAQVVGRKVVWDQRRSNQGRGDMWAPCPFHQERTASFHVDDRKGFYYCFGCHAKGDAITFVRESENVDFMTAVEILAREAGMTMPARDPQAAKVADRRQQLVAVVEAAVQHYRLLLRGGGGQGARDYLARRGLDQAAQERWRIGFAPDRRDGLITALGAKGIAVAALIEAGLAIAPDGGGAPYDRFRDRVIFPIRDARDRAISLGGRALNPAARAKYLNGPETVLFDKGRSLFNHGPARAAAGRTGPLVVAEGYMDVIALSEAGFPATVAPLGTAITAEQLQLLWRIHDEPVIALDGDEAGLRAAGRLVDLALPLVVAGKGLRFALLPGGMDPDDVIRSGGAAAFRQLLDGALPMAELLWQRETAGHSFDSPERRAALDQRLRALLAKVADPGLRPHYASEFRRRRGELFGAAPRAGRFQGWRRVAAPAAPLPGTRASALAAPGGGIADGLREGVVLAVLASWPALIAEYEDALIRLECAAPDAAALRAALLQAAGATDPAAVIRAQAGAELDSLLARPHLQVVPAFRRPEGDAVARLCLDEELAKLEAARIRRQEIAEAVADADGFMDEGTTWRLGQAATAVNRAARAVSGPDMNADGEQQALSERLQKMIDDQVWVKQRRQGFPQP